MSTADACSRCVTPTIAPLLSPDPPPLTACAGVSAPTADPVAAVGREARQAAGEQARGHVRQTEEGRSLLDQAKGDSVVFRFLLHTDCLCI